MNYRKFGNTGVELSILGFGAMRFPEKEVEGKKELDWDESIEIIRQGIDLGINYIDSAYFYCNYQSENIVGKALKDGYREKVYLSTKLPVFNMEKPQDFEKFLNEQLEKLDTTKIDFYHFHALDKKIWEEKFLKWNLIDRAKKAKEDGKIGHISFSFHDKPEVLKTIIDSGFFESMLVQYNLLDRVNEEMISYAASKGLGVAIMGPVGGGRLEIPSGPIMDMAPEGVGSPVELALRFVLANPDVHCALSGMGSKKMVEENVTVASSEKTLTTDEMAEINRISQLYKERSDLVCTNCGYCKPCPHEVNIPLVFELLNYYRVYGLEKHAIDVYSQIGKVPWFPGKTGEACTECGECLPKCPQNIEIVDQLKTAHKILGK